ncbi:MAG: hypothetical protein L6306_10670, partial [Planctomycetales bacterium]|nr:hypothetical protein [Planctomycetales bacterium]
MDRVLAGGRKRQAELLSHSDGILANAEREGRDPTLAEQKLLDSDKVELDATAKIIGRQNALNEERRTTMPTMKNGFEDFSFGGDPDDRSGAAIDGESKPSVKGRVGATFAQLFPQTSRGGSRMSSGEFFSAVASGTYHPELLMMKEGSGASGGWIVPEQVTADYLGAVYESSIVLPRATTFPMIGPTLKIGGFDASSAEDGTLFGGMEWLWLPEEGSGTVKNP